MSRRLLSALVGAFGLLLVVAAVASGHTQRSAERDAVASEERASATVRRTAATPQPTPKQRAAINVCPRGAEGLGNSARRSIRRKLLGDDGRLDLDALAEMSNLAVAAGRYLERARAEPALPQRLGRSQTLNANGELQWSVLSTPKIGCVALPRHQTPRH